MREFDTIETPENVALELPLAGIGMRLLAGFLDHLLIGLLGAVGALVVWASWFAYITDLAHIAIWTWAVLLVAAFTIYWFYFLGFEWAWHGQTPGKRAVQIRVVRDGGQPLDFLGSVIRNLLRVVDSMLLYSVGGVAMFFSQRVQRLGDMAAGTVVVSEQELEYSASADQRTGFDWEIELTPEGLRRSGLTPIEYQALASYWMRREQLDGDARERLLPRLLEPIFKRQGRVLPEAELPQLERCVEQLLNERPGDQPIERGS